MPRGKCGSKSIFRAAESSVCPVFPIAVEMERPLKLEPGKEYEIALYIQDTIGVLYINNDVAFGFRMYNWKNRHLGFFVSDGTMEVKDAAVLTE